VENGESIKLWVAVAAIILCAAGIVLVIDFKTKREILTGINLAHDDLEKLGVLHGIYTSERGVDNTASIARIVDPANGRVPMDYAATLEEGVANSRSDQKHTGIDGDHAEFPKRSRRASHPGIQADGKRVGSRTVAKIPKEDTK
jgi:hypothetical protein